jgi:hypothetical protein
MGESYPHTWWRILFFHRFSSLIDLDQAKSVQFTSAQLSSAHLFPEEVDIFRPLNLGLLAVSYRVDVYCLVKSHHASSIISYAPLNTSKEGSIATCCLLEGVCEGQLQELSCLFCH